MIHNVTFYTNFELGRSYNNNDAALHPAALSQRIHPMTRYSHIHFIENLMCIHWGTAGSWIEYRYPVRIFCGLHN